MPAGPGVPSIKTYRIDANLSKLQVLEELVKI